MDPICDDLEAEHEALDVLVRDLPDEAWDRLTPAEGLARLAVVDVDAFQASAKALLGSRRRGDDPSIAPGREVAPAQLLASWREGRTALLAALRAIDASARLPWYGPPMAARSFATARWLMETWAHGQDVVDTLGVEREATDRLRHVAHIGVRARPFAYFTNDRCQPPEGEI